MVRRIIQSSILISLIFAAVHTNAQLSINQFLNSAQEDASLKLLDEKSNYLQSKPYRLSILNKLEVRAQNNELHSPNQRYGVRVTPANPWEIRSNNNYYKAFQETLASEKDIALKEALENRYIMVIDFLYLSELNALKEKEKGFLDAQLSTVEKQQYSKSFNVNDFIDLQLEQMSEDVELASIAYELTNQISKIDLLVKSNNGSKLDWNINDIISIAHIEIVLDSLVSLNVTSTMLAYQDKRINLAQREYTLKKSNINLGFIQTQYTNGRTEKERNPWGLSAGINIPLTNPNKGDMAKRHLEVIEAKQSKAAAEIDLQSDRNREIVKLKNLIQRHIEMQAKINSINVGSLNNTLTLINSSNPVAIIKFNSNLLKLQLILLKLQQSILTSYIVLLNMHDLLHQRPLVNYLSSDFKKIAVE